MQAAEGSLLSASPPSFKSYSSDKLGMIAARVIQEFQRDSQHSISSENNTAWNQKGCLFDSWNSDADSNFLQQVQRIHVGHNCENVNGNKQGVDEGDDDFEFALVSRDEACYSAISSADNFFNKDQIKPMYPIFDQSLLIDYAKNGVMDNEHKSASSGFKPSAVANDKGTRHRRPPLKKLMFEERGTVLCSSWMSDDLDRQQHGTYCGWNQKPVRESSCKKNKSIGTASKKWNLRNLLVRSQNDRNHHHDRNKATASGVAKLTEIKKAPSDRDAKG